MITGSCHCGAVRITVAEIPATVTSCNCSICRRLGTLCAYYRPAEVTVTHDPGALASYVWGDRCIAFRRCATCGCFTHWEDMRPKPADRMGVNARMLDIDLNAIPVEFCDGASFPVSAGSET